MQSRSTRPKRPIVFIELLLVGSLDQLVHQIPGEGVVDEVALHGGLGAQDDDDLPVSESPIRPSG